MRKLISKAIYVLGLCTLLFGIYVSTFYFVHNKIIRPFEIKNRNETHSIRPIYNVVYYPMRKFIANGSSITSKMQEIHYGTLKKPSSRSKKERGYRSAKIDTPDSLMMIGFTGKQSILKKFDEIKYGSYVKMVFGVALTKKHDRFINRLISFEVIDLMDDPRIKKESFSDEDKQKIWDDYSGLQGEPEACAVQFINDYKDKVLKHCQQAGYAQNIGGGCYHTMGYAINASVIKQALQTCIPENKPPP